MTTRAVFITGAASGIGLAAARRFAAEGWRVGLADVDAGRLVAATDAIGGLVAAYQLDVRDHTAWDGALAAFAGSSGGRLDVLVNNAGVARYGWIEELTPAETDQMVAVNVGGVINGVRAGLALLKATPGSRVINVASVAGLVGTPKLAVYSATKFAVRGLSDALEIELARFGIGVSCILPWFIETPLLDQQTETTGGSIRASLNGQPVYDAGDVAEAIWQAATRGGRRHVVGGQAKLVDRLARWAPAMLRSQLRGMVGG